MVIGNGLIAKAFHEFANDDHFLFFCSGVSNSLCRERSEFERERNLLMEHLAKHPNKMLVYFSTCSIKDPSMKNSLYVRHKLEIEHLINARCNSYQIFRLSNVVGSSSNNVTVLNFLFNAIKTGQAFELWQNSSRNLIDVEDAVAIVTDILKTQKPLNSVINVANPHSYSVNYIVKAIEVFLGKHGHYTAIKKGQPFAIPTPEIQPIIRNLGIDFNHDYLDRLLQKYYVQ